MKHCVVVLAVFALGGCGVKTVDIYNMDTDEGSRRLVKRNDIKILITRDGDLSVKVDQSQYVNYGNWNVHAVNTAKECRKVKVLWNLSGLVYKPLSKGYVRIRPSHAATIGILSDEIVRYADFTYTMKGYGRVREVLTKQCDK